MNSERFVNIYCVVLREFSIRGAAASGRRGGRVGVRDEAVVRMSKDTNAAVIASTAYYLLCCWKRLIDT